MILTKQRTTLIQSTADPLAIIEYAGRTCYASALSLTPELQNSFVRQLVRQKHESVLEHASATFEIITSRDISHEIVRHRIASYSQESTRYRDYKQLTFIIPPWVNIEEGEYTEKPDYVKHETVSIWFEQLLFAEKTYLRLRELDCAPEVARSVLPGQTKTKLVATANFRQWRHFIKLRSAPAAHAEIREIAIRILQELRQLAPPAFFDL